MKRSASLFTGGGVLACVVALACSAFTSIDGSKVPTIGSDAAPPTCAQTCDRLAALCGYAPTECATVDGGSYCELNFDDLHRGCVGSAANCQEAWNCANAPAPDASDDAGSDADTGAGGDASGGSDAGGDT